MIKKYPSINKWQSQISDLSKCLSSLSVNSLDSQLLEVEQAFSLWQEKTISIRENSKTVFFIGNGASASMASHISADMCKNAHIHTEVFTDLSQITAVANDLGYDQVFSVPLSFRMKKDDMLVVISSSGESPNVLNAVEIAKKADGYVVTLSAMNPNNNLRRSGDLNFWVPADAYGLAETSHAAILHHWMDMMAEIAI
ncbi:Phosphoheptose isomerase [Desulfamplus magnetovallimortis]|uniref:Phosphoheptose isomerase n=1 Tax=Desulfamplus magnetovallimortis TaxID=1246637 RepID=A0A1W1HF10_9BACT|nr:SIS domain-containing protein [Desulfamplus magnetovallimortis]SLM30988.1 Phosphoheptose isomerase [Desulfamplus magnetovallimortis]